MRYLKTAGTVMLWALQIFATVGFTVAGIGKFRSAFWIAAFARWGFSDGFRMLIGVLELAGGLLLAFPRTTSYAAVLIGCIMVGAAGTLVLHKEPWAAPVFWLVIMALLGIARRRRAWRPVSRTVPAALNQV